MKEYKFICPNCHGTSIERTEFGCVVTYTVFGFNDQTLPEYGDNIVHESEDGHFNCEACGRVIPIDEVEDDGYSSDEDKLVEWLSRQPYNADQLLEDL